MRLAAMSLALMLLLPVISSAQNTTGSPAEPVSKIQPVKPAPVDCKRYQTWSQAEERCVSVVTCETTKKPWALRCLVKGEYKNTSLQNLYRSGFHLSEISPKGAYFFKDGK